MSMSVRIPAFGFTPNMRSKRLPDGTYSIQKPLPQKLSIPKILVSALKVGIPLVMYQPSCILISCLSFVYRVCHRYRGP